MRKGIILAGGFGSRLRPLTNGLSKQVLPVYDKPMIYYPLSTLMEIGIQDILVIVRPKDKKLFKTILKDGSQWGIKIQYAEQDIPKGLAEAFIIGKEFIGDDDVVMILGDNIFYGATLPKVCEDIMIANEPTIFGYYVQDPTAYGVVEFDEITMAVKRVEEKPKIPQSHYAIPGLYFFPNDVVDKAERVTPSARNELEITSIMEQYIKENNLWIYKLDYTIWFDAGTHDALLEAGNFVQTVEKRLGMKICNPIDIAKKKGWVSE